MLKKIHNPDILTCLANLSSDEVFTSPSLANSVLDNLPKEIWSDHEITFLDPVSKSGVFLREVTKRLIVGLEKKYPNLEQRVEHILKKQVFGIGITKLTAEISRRTMYCSKKANSKYSIVNFNNEEGNLIFYETSHIWNKYGKCICCGANKELYNREKDLESYAYSFIHNINLEELFDMKFDVIIGNPPYQMNDGGAGASAKPIYHKFIDAAKKLNPRYFSFIIPARWYNGGKGLDEFRSDMLSDKRISNLHDFQDTNDVFPGLNIRGGICFFLWEREFQGKCKVINYRNKVPNEPQERYLKEKDLNIFLRHNESISIYEKVKKFQEDSFSSIVSSRKPFGLGTNFNDFSSKKTDLDNLKLYRFGECKFISRSKVLQNEDKIYKYKILVPKASPGDDSFPHLILSKPILSEPDSLCTETYVMVGPFKDKEISTNVCNYMITSFFRFMVLLSKSTQDVTRKTYSLVPIQDFNYSWTDEQLYEKYKFDPKEINFINSLIRKFNFKYE